MTSLPVFNCRLLAKNVTSDLPDPLLAAGIILKRGANSGPSFPQSSSPNMPASRNVEPLPTAEFSFSSIPAPFTDRSVSVPALAGFVTDFARASSAGLVLNAIPFGVQTLERWFFEKYPSVRTAISYFGEKFGSYGFARACTLARAPHLYGYLSPGYIGAQARLKELGAYYPSNALSALMNSPRYRAYAADSYAMGEKPCSGDLWIAPQPTPSGFDRLTNTIDSAGNLYRALWGSAQKAVTGAAAATLQVKGAAEFVYGNESLVFKKVAAFEGLLAVLNVLTSVGDILEAGVTDEDRISVRYELLTLWDRAADSGNRNAYMACLATAVAYKYRQPLGAVLASLTDANQNVLDMAHATLCEFCYGLKTIYHSY